MRGIQTAVVILILATVGGCGTARGTIRAIREIGSGILNDSEGIVDGIADRDRKENPDSGK